jgi:hypothetical protein
MSEKLEKPKNCPRCEKKGRETVATTDVELEEIFGLRRVPDGGKKTGKKKAIAQSHCRKCRSDQSKERRAKAKAEAAAAEKANAKEANE